MVSAALGLYTSYLVLVLVPKIGTSSIDWAELSRFHLKRRQNPVSETCVLNKNRMMDNVRKNNN
jgi:hypothetical protein